MPSAWRLVKERHAATAFDGEGAARHGGRWNPHGCRIVYTSESLSLAALETLVHLVPPVAGRYVAIRIEFEAALVERLEPGRLPSGWRREPPGSPSQSIGGAWARQSRSAILAVPSAIIPEETNFLLNPLHPDFRRISFGKPELFAFDPRLLTDRQGG